MAGRATRYSVFVPFAVSVSSHVVGRRSKVFAVTSTKSLASTPSAASNRTSARRFVALMGSVIFWESDTSIGFVCNP